MSTTPRKIGLLLALFLLGLGIFAIFRNEPTVTGAPAPVTVGQELTPAPTTAKLSISPTSTTPSAQQSEIFRDAQSHSPEQLSQQSRLLSRCENLTRRRSADELAKILDSQPLPNGVKKEDAAQWRKMVEECRGVKEEDYAAIPNMILAAADGGNRFAAMTLAFHPPQKNQGPEALAIWQEAVVRNLNALGDAEAMSTLGDVYLKGTLGNRDMAKAAESYTRSMSLAQPGNAFYTHSKNMRDWINENQDKNAPSPKG